MLKSAAVVLAIISLHGTTLAAQRATRFGLGGGVSIPTSDLSDAAQTGWHALGTLAFGGPMQALGLRVDAAYHTFAFTDATAGSSADGAQAVASATANFTYRLPATRSPLSPYVITGLGAYRTGCTGDVDCDDTTRFGWNAGLGTKWYLRGATWFVEARYHRTTREGRGVPYVPVTLGILL